MPKALGAATAVFAIMIAGCSSVSAVTPMGQDTYTVGSKVRGGFDSWNEVKAKALKPALAYCQAQGKDMQVLRVETHGVRSLTPQEAEVTFKCINQSS